MKKYIFLVFLSICWITAFGQKPVPKSGGALVNDYARLMNQRQIIALNNKLLQYQRETSTQIAIVTEESLQGEDIFDYTVRLAQEWGIGQEGKDNGILIYVSKQDRQLYIQTGYGAEGFLPDAMARRIIENIIKPSFRVGRFYEGFDQATDVIMDLGKGEYTAEEWNRKTSEGGIPVVFILILIIVIIIILSNMGNDGDGGYYRGGRYDMDDRPHRRRRRGGGWIIFPGGFGGGGDWSGGGGGFGGFGGGDFGGFGGGDFGGFGGGGFGGGGAGGSW